MSQEQIQLVQKTQQLLHGPLKHVRAAALAAALLPLASVAAAPAQAQVECDASGGCTVYGTISGIVFNDENNNGFQDAGEPGIEDAKVSIKVGGDTLQSETGPDGIYVFSVPEGTYTIGVQVPQGTQPSPSNVGDDTFDSDGVPDGFGFSVTTVMVVGPNNSDTDFGFFTPSVPQSPGTGTPGYWKNHPDAWPVNEIRVGGVTYTKALAIAWLGKVGKDKTTTMFSSLVPAMLNLLIGNDGSCISAAIAAGNKWMTASPIGYGPVGSNVPASSYAWSIGEPTHITLDAYNNGRLCAPHRN